MNITQVCSTCKKHVTDYLICLVCKTGAYCNRECKNLDTKHNCSENRDALIASYIIRVLAHKLYDNEKFLAISTKRKGKRFSRVPVIFIRSDSKICDIIENPAQYAKLITTLEIEAIFKKYSVPIPESYTKINGLLLYPSEAGLSFGVIGD